MPYGKGIEDCNMACASRSMKFTSRYPEVLYSVSSISNLIDLNKLINLSISDKNDQLCDAMT